MRHDEATHRDPDIRSGEEVFTGTRVPVQNLVDIVTHGGSLDEFFNAFPSVQRWQVQALLEQRDFGADHERDRRRFLRALQERGENIVADAKHLDPIQVDLARWSDALQRHVDIPASALFLMACLAHEVESVVPRDTVTPALRAWLFRVEELVTHLVGANTWADAVQVLRIPERSARSLAAWGESGDAPPLLRDLLATSLEQRDGSD